MLVAGAGGFAKQLLEVFSQLGIIRNVVLFDNVTLPRNNTLYDFIPILHDEQDVITWFRERNDNRFVLGVGNPVHRKKLDDYMIQLGGRLESLASPTAIISQVSCSIRDGVNILSAAVIENGVSIDRAAFVNVGAIITHDCSIGSYSEIGPGVIVCGDSHIGSFCSVGAGSIIIPKVRIGNNVIVGAGSVVTKDVPGNVMVAGVPAQIKKQY